MSAVPTPELLDGLLRRLRSLLSEEDDPEPRGLADWLRRQVGAEVGLVDGAGRAEFATAGLTADVLSELRPTLARLADGRLRAAAAQVGGLDVRCEAVGRGVPRPVLVVAAGTELPREAVSVASHAGLVVHAARRARDGEDAAVRYRRAAARLRLGVFMALMEGDLTLARRMTAGAVPPLLDAGRLRIYLVHCPPEDRMRLAAAYQDAAGYHGRGLIVPCPAFDPHLICCVPADEEDGEDEEGDGIGALVRSLVQDDPRYWLGISDPHPLQSTADAYEQARHALAVARHLPGRVAASHGHVPLAPLLPRRQALAWARDLLAPLAAAPKMTVDITRLALTLPRSGVGRLLGISRNTVTAHLRRVEDALGVDLRDTHSRAELALALAVSALPPDSGEPPSVAPSTLESVLAGEDAVTWARTFLKPLDDEDVERTLRAWLAARTDAQETARRLGLNRSTVRAHLLKAERLLERELLPPGPGAHDLIHAFRIIDAA